MRVGELVRLKIEHARLLREKGESDPTVRILARRIDEMMGGEDMEDVFE